MFHGNEGQQSYSAEIQEDGTYNVPVLSGGTYKVCVETASLKPTETKSSYGTGAPGPKGAAPKIDPKSLPEGYQPSSPALASAATKAKRYTAIPEKYASATSTPLSYDFPGGQQTFDIEIK
ncbi:MAG TPA: hypothetical protein VGE74_29120 [Gemmata sp.]